MDLGSGILKEERKPRSILMLQSPNYLLMSHAVLEVSTLLALLAR
jgi:hypothetical protein